MLGERLTGRSTWRTGHRRGVVFREGNTFDGVPNEEVGVHRALPFYYYVASVNESVVT